MKTLFNATLSRMYLMGSMSLAGLSGACSAGDGQDGTTVEAGPLLCLLQGDQGTAPMNVTCTVTIGEAQASEEGVDTSVTNILQVLVLPDLCPGFVDDEVLADAASFNAELRSRLSEAYVQSRIGWTVQSAECAFQALAAR